MKNLLRGNTRDHALAILLAVVLWLFVKSTVIPVRPIELSSLTLNGVALEWRNLPSDMEFVSSLPQTVAVLIRGDKGEVEKTIAKDLTAYLDFKGLSEGSHQVAIRVDAPAGISIGSSTPARITVSLERIISIQLPVSLSLVGQPKTNFLAVPGVVDPEVVVVIGGRSKVARLAPLVINVDISGVDTSINAMASLQLLDTDGKAVTGVSVSPIQVKYTQPIHPMKTVPLVAKAQAPFPSGVKDVQLLLNIKEVTIAGPLEVLRDISSVTLSVAVPSQVGESLVEVPVVVPSGTFLVAPVIVSVRLTTIGP
ncbi:MAG: CdaR family protein [bacterium]|nr:CdaR family protein [bacterium]